MHAGMINGTPSLTSLPKDGEVTCEVRPPRSPIRSLTSLDQAELQSPDEDCLSHSATHPTARAVLEETSPLENKTISDSSAYHIHTNRRGYLTVPAPISFGN